MADCWSVLPFGVVLVFVLQLLRWIHKATLYHSVYNLELQSSEEMRSWIFLLHAKFQLINKNLLIFLYLFLWLCIIVKDFEPQIQKAASSLNKSYKFLGVVPPPRWTLPVLIDRYWTRSLKKCLLFHTEVRNTVSRLLCLLFPRVLVESRLVIKDATFKKTPSLKCLKRLVCCLGSIRICDITVSRFVWCPPPTRDSLLPVSLCF